MIGDTKLRERAARKEMSDQVGLEIAGISAMDDEGLPAVETVNLKVHGGEIVGVAGVSGNGQSELVEVLSGQREPSGGQIFIEGADYEPVATTWTSSRSSACRRSRSRTPPFGA